MTKGLGALGFLEKWALLLTLCIIALLLVGFSLYDFKAWRSPAGLQFFTAEDHSVWDMLTIVAGTLIVVQGFETTRYLGSDFDADTRVRASRNSQFISTAVYLLFVTVSLPLVHTLKGKYDDNSLMQIASAASTLLVAPLVLAATLSQFSAAVADGLAATGNLEEVTHNHLKQKFGILLVGGGAIALTWTASTMEIVALASRAFAFYYFFQCMVALTITKNPSQRVFFALVAGILAFITVFAVPAS
jgi:hypothetical protein